MRLVAVLRLRIIQKILIGFVHAGSGFAAEILVDSRRRLLFGAFQTSLSGNGVRTVANPNSLIRSFLRRPLMLDPGDLDLVRRGFSPASPAVQPKLDAVVRSFAAGYNAMITGRPGEQAFPDMSPELRGFAFEGAAMSAVLLDLLTLTGGRRLATLHRHAGRRYAHLIHVGAGWAFARLHVSPWTAIRAHQPVLRWLAWDGWGFHQAFFRPEAVFDGQVERSARGAVLSIRDQGTGRALWFYAGADPARIADVIGGFPQGRRADLWAGIGLAAGYTGAQPADVLERLLQVSDGYHDHLAQGAAFAAKAHCLSGVVTSEVASAVKLLTGAETDVAAAWTDTALAAVKTAEDSPQTYERWRAGTRHAWSLHSGGGER
ncbi:DUF1702 family protein [Nonomuraea muscovyensis]|uniref:DUF1702 family protein n=1 Tax=Nonomuraea muscovyensis TaxID=1124761 RepID=A0A7X0F0R9_9ACTN|nr:DUF1702 family protein [Nonomuraea muscovyensis]MBB6351198.1 hypothetical protein [Nonomuraea muscovyensis]